MVASLTNLTGWIARVVLAATALCFNGPLLVTPDESTHGMATERASFQHENGGNGEFHASLTVGQGKKQVTVRLEVGRTKERGEDEAL